MESLGKILDQSERILAALCVLAFAVMLVLGIATVVFRYVVEASLVFPDEMIRYLFVWLIALGSAVAYRRNAHAAIGALVARLPPVSRRACLLLATLLCGLFFAVIFWNGVLTTLRMERQISPALQIPMSWAYAAIPTGMAFLFVYTVELFLAQWRAPAPDLRADDR